MNQYIFLYPILDYLRGRTGITDADVKFLRTIIDARYRNERYVISWIFPSSEKDRNKPDMTNCLASIGITPGDTIIANGVSWDDFIFNDIPIDQSFIINQISRHTKNIVLGGFHQWDCVDTLAAAVHACGYNVFVDEDTTDLFFHATKELPPLVRAEWSLKALGLPDHLISFAAENRKDKPWFTQL